MKKKLISFICIVILCVGILSACERSAIKLDKPRLDFDEATQTISWEGCDNALGYSVKIDELNIDAEVKNKNSDGRFEYKILHRLTSTYTVNVRARGDGVSYIDSDVETLNLVYADIGLLRMGMNIGGISYYNNHTLMFNDIFLSSTNFKTQSGWNDTLNVELASDGYPVGYASNEYSKRVIFLINNIYTGDYVLLFDGEGEFAFSGNINVTDVKDGEVHINIFNTDSVPPEHRWVTINWSKVGNHIRNIRIIPKEFYQSEETMPLFRQDFLDGLKDMRTLRFMDAVKTNGSKQVYWSDRPHVDDFTFEPNGLPIEYLIELCNTLNVDGWFCVPHKATDDYIENLAKLIKQKLNSHLKVYIEYSNEVWNTGFAQAIYVRDNAPNSADAYVSQELAKLGAAGQNLHLKSAYMMMRTFNIFESVFSASERNRLITVGAIHTNNWIEYTRQTLKYWADNNAMPDAVAGTAYFGYETSFWNEDAIPYDVLPRESADDLNEYFHNIWNANPQEVTADDIIDAVFTIWEYTIEPAVKESVMAIKDSGAMYMVYEGGQHMQPHKQGVWDYNQAVYDAQISPRMYDLYTKNFELHASLECDMFMNFSYIGKRESQWGSWGVLEQASDIYAPNLEVISPKYKAILDSNKIPTRIIPQPY